MSKRGPQSSLNHLNWNETEEPEEMGEFTKASEDIIKQRVIKKARRRVATDSADSTAPANASLFGSFKGFVSTPIAKDDEKASTTKTFSFLSNLATKTNGNGTATVSSSGGVGGSSTMPMFSFGSNASSSTTADTAKKPFSFGSPSGLKADSTDASTKVTSPSFGLSATDAKKSMFSLSGSSTAKPSTEATSEPEKPKATSLFGSVAAKSDSDKNTANAASKDSPPDTVKSTFSFGSNVAKADTVDTSKPLFTFGSPSSALKDTTSSIKTGFLFGSSAANSDKTEASDKKSVTFGSITTKDPDIALPKTTFSFGSIAPKADSTDKEKQPATVGSTTKDTPAASSPKTTFSFGTNSSNTIQGFGSSPAKTNAADSEKVTFSFGVPPSSKEDAVKADPKPTFAKPKEDAAKTDPKPVFAKPKETSQDVIKKMFDFKSSKSSNPKPADAKTANKSAITFTLHPAPSTTPKTIRPPYAGMPSFQTSVIGLNKSFVAWVSEKVKDNPFCSLLPVFKDYEKYYAQFEADNSQATTSKPSGNGKQPETSTKLAVKGTGKPSFSFGTIPEEKEPEQDKEKPSFSFGTLPKAKEPEKDKPSFSFGTLPKEKEPEKDKEKPSFSFGTLPKQAEPEKDKEKPSFSFGTLPKEKEPEKAKEKPSFSFGTLPKQTEPEKGKEKPSFSFGTITKDKEPEKEADKPSFSFGTLAKESGAKDPAVPFGGGFTFGSPKSFSFGSVGKDSTVPSPSSSVATSSPSFFAGASTFGAKPLAPGGFTFGNLSKPNPPPDSSAADNEAEAEEPPQVEFVPVEEKDSVYSKRCKMFVKVKNEYSDRGVGTLHIKKVEGKVQVLVRADTNLGNILLNIILNESVPLQRMGKNNVMMICLPTPESKPPPSSVLLRVKTAEEADELHETLLKYKPK